MKKRIGLIGDNSIGYVEKLKEILLNDCVAVLIDWRIPLQVAIGMMCSYEVNEFYIEDNRIIDVNVPNELKMMLYTGCNNKITELPTSFYNEFAKIFDNYSDDDAVIFFSSGTTGKAKGIRLSFGAINRNVDSIIEYMQLQFDDTIFISKALSHSSTFTGELFVGLKSRMKIIIGPTVTSPVSSLKAIDKYGVTIWCINPTLLKIFLAVLEKQKFALSTLKKIYISGAVIDKITLEYASLLLENIQVLNMYGLTEAGPRVTVQGIHKNNKVGSVGFPICGVEVKIISNCGKEVPNDQKGIIYIKTHSLMNGYLTGYERVSLYKDWFNTGDIGYIDQDGELFLVGRTDNMILHGAHNVFPEEIEKTIKEHKDIFDCALFGEKHEIYGERIICLYVSDICNSSELRSYCLSKLASYEIPSEFIKVSSIPYNSNGKMMRNKLKEIYENERGRYE